MYDKHLRIFLVILSSVSHICQIYWISDEALQQLKPNLSSLLFLLSTAILAVTKLEAPKTPFCWPNAFVFFYKIIAMLLLPCVSLRVFWLPLIQIIARVQAALALFIKTWNPKFLPALVRLLNCPTFQGLEQLIISVYIFCSITKATGHYWQIKKGLKSIANLRSNKNQATADDTDSDCDSQ